MRLTRGPSRIRRDWVEGLEARGVEALAYVEIVSVVSRIAAVDGFHRMLGIDLPGFPDPEPAPPTNAFDLNARPGRGFVPMTKGYGLWWALSLIPAAYRRMEDLHNTLYLTPEQMLGDGSPRRASRPQIELVATRTAALNECFY